MKKTKKKNTISSHTSLRFKLALLSPFLIAAAVIGMHMGYSELKNRFLAQAEIKDAETQITVNAGKMVDAETIKLLLGLKPGANLAKIDFDQLRLKILKERPNLREITITRKLPDQLIVDAEERVPLARIAPKGKRPQGLVVDAEGIIFSRIPGTRSLPVIYDSFTAQLTPGTQLSVQALAAIRVIEAMKDDELKDLTIKHIEVSAPDCLNVVFDNTEQTELMLAWPYMGEINSGESRFSLLKRLKRFHSVYKTRLGFKYWDAASSEDITCSEKKGKFR